MKSDERKWNMYTRARMNARQVGADAGDGAVADVEGLNGNCGGTALEEGGPCRSEDRKTYGHYRQKRNQAHALP